MVNRAVTVAVALAAGSAGCVLLVTKPRPSGWEASQPPRECPALLLPHIVDGVFAVAGGLLALWGTAVVAVNGCRSSGGPGEPGQFRCTELGGAIAGGAVVVGGAVAATVVGRRRNRRCREDTADHLDWLAARAREQRAAAEAPSPPLLDAGAVDAGAVDAGAVDAGPIRAGDPGR